MRNHLFVIVLVIALAFSSCANRGAGPQGGPRDTIPPKVLKETPANGTLSFSGKKIDIHFNEYIQLDDIQKNVLISPPQQTPPEVKAVGKSLSVVFQQDLQDSTTYTIDFGAAICDYNEKTPLRNYVFSFSTGDYIDSLEVSGIVLNAENLDPVSDVVVGIHSNLHDSALSALPFTRICRSDEEGYFTIHNICTGTYRLYALNDISRDYLYQPGEDLAFANTLVMPTATTQMVADTLWRDTIGINPVTLDTLFTRLIDTVRTSLQTTYEPSDLVLWYFTEDKQRHYFRGVYREEQHCFTLIFATPQDSLPLIRPLSPSQCDSLATDSAWVNWMDYSLLQSSPEHDTLTFWLTDSVAIAQDSIHMEITYLASDSVYNLVPRTDTVLAVYRRPRMSAKAYEAAQRKKRERTLELKTNASSKFEIYDTIRIASDFPLDSLHADRIHLAHKVDTTLQPMPVRLVISDSIRQNILIVAALKPSESYVLDIDSAACHDIYGACNLAFKRDIKLKSLDEYATILIRLSDYNPLIRLQLLNEKDVVIRELPALPDGTKFEYLTPATYYLRLYIDHNADGHWTTGDWLTRRQPEPVYYFPKKLKLRANWDFEEIFDYQAVPQIDSKPSALIKKPAGKS